MIAPGPGLGFRSMSAATSSTRVDLPDSIVAVRARFTTRWAEPAPPARWVPASAAALGVLAAVLFPGGPGLGINLPLGGLAAAIPIGLLARGSGRRRGRARPIGRAAVALGLVSLGLMAVAAVRASDPLTGGCLLAALGLAAVVCLDARRWRHFPLMIPVAMVAAARTVTWSGRMLRIEDAGSRLRPWLVGAVIGLLCTLAVGGLLAEADPTFADALGVVLHPLFSSLMPARVITFGFTTLVVMGAAFAVSSPFGWSRPVPAARRPARHPAEWLVPLLLVTAIITAFLLVEAASLFDGRELVTHEAGVSHADRARQGFGQLTAVTLIVVGLLSWAGGQAARGERPRRKELGLAGGALLALTLVLAGSALRRLWLYQEAYGWTVTRLNAGAFEAWVVVVLLGVGLGWWLRRTDLLPRFVIGSAGLGLLALSLAGPDALVARADVNRFAATGVIDTSYLSWLSADAVPALDRLPEPQRSCALAQQTIAHDSWPAWNWGRSRADRILQARPAGPCSPDS